LGSFRAVWIGFNIQDQLVNCTFLILKSGNTTPIRRRILLTVWAKFVVV